MSPLYSLNYPYGPIDLFESSFILKGLRGEKILLLLAYYLIAIAFLALHFTGHLARWNLEWLIYVLAVTVFPAVFFL